MGEANDNLLLKDFLFAQGLLNNGDLYGPLEQAIAWLSMLAFFGMAAIIMIYLRQRDDVRNRTLLWSVIGLTLWCGLYVLVTFILPPVTVYAPVLAVVKLSVGLAAILTTGLLFLRLPSSSAAPSLQGLQEVNRRLAKKIKRQSKDIDRLSSTETGFQFLLKNSPFGVAVLNLKGEWMQINQPFCVLLGYRCEELLNTDFQRITHPDDLAQDLYYMEQFIKNDIKEAKWEKRYLRHDGTAVWVMLNVTLVGDIDKGDGYFIAQVVDIHDLKTGEATSLARADLLELLIEERTYELKQTNEDLENFIYAITHDLRSPLTNVRSLSEVMIEEIQEGAPAATLQDLANKIGINALRIDRLIIDLLNFSRAGRHTLNKEVLDMTALAQEAFDTMMVEYAGRNIKLNLAPLLPAHGDQSVIRQVWLNLIGNALKYANNQAAVQLEVGSYSDHEQQVYSVRDNGVGFDERYSHKLFELFQRLHSAEKFAGTGLGLAVANRIIQKHGGRMWAESPSSEGATFYFSLPVPKAAAKA